MAADHVAPARHQWSHDDPRWGVWQIPERELRVLPDVEGRDVLEAGCGTAYWSAWLARRGARALGLDNSPNQLATARAMRAEHAIRLPLVHADAERMPFPDESFDLVLSEYGASIWCDPYRWIPEAARVLRPGGELVFLRNATLLVLCVTPDDRVDEHLKRPLFGMHRIEWWDDLSVEFHLPAGDMVRLLRRCGFEILDLVEVQAPPDADPKWFDYANPTWAQRWPSEEIWRARLHV